MKNKIFHLFIILIYCFSSIDAQERKFNYSKKITISDGLAHNGVTSILKDNRGFIWVGTYEGINKHDGYKITTYKNTIDKDILTSNRVRALANDKKNNIWIGTDEGITIYETSQEKFIKLLPDNTNKNNNNPSIIRKILPNKKGNQVFCLTEGKGILIFSDSYKLLNQLIPIKNNLTFFDGIELDNGDLLISSSDGLYLLDVLNNILTPILKSEIKFSNSIIKLKELVYLTTLSDGIAIIEFNSNTKKIKLVRRVIQNQQFNSALIDDNNRLWLGTLNNGIIQIDNVDKILQSNNDYTISHFTDNLQRLRISCLFFSFDNVWVGSFNEGLYKFNTKESPFKYYKSEMGYPYGIKTNNVNYISSLDKDRFYVTATYGGVGLYNTTTHQFEPLPYNLPKKYFKKISTVFIDSKKNTWIKVIDEGLFRVKKGTENLVKITNDLLASKSSIPYRSLSEDKKGNIWVGAVSDVIKISIDSLNKITNVESLKENPFFSDSELSLVRYVYADPLKDVVWVGTDAGGLYKIQSNINLNDAKINQFNEDSKNQKALASNFITSVIRLSNGDLWVGTENGGLNRVIEKDDFLKFIPITEKQGLSNNVVKSILNDDENNLWIATNIGINKFDLNTNVFRRFNLADGIPFEDFWYPSKKLKNGTLVFSGLDGFSYFKPNNVSNKEDLPNVLLENFEIFNKRIYPKDTLNNRVLFDNSVSELSEIHLKHNENVFSLDIVSLHYSNPKNHLIKHKLSPINKNWVESYSNKNTINYSGLQPGEYTLSYMASNSLNEWTQPKTFKIFIEPPFWKTNFAYSLYVALLLFLIFVTVYFITKIQSLNHKVEIEKIEKDAAKELNDSKLRFFSNISHEIKTPITLISGPVETLLDNFKKSNEINEKLKLVKRQIKKIKRLVNQANDFQKAEANLLKMNYSRFNFNKFIQEITDDFMFLASKDDKKFEILTNNENIIVTADKDKLEKIFNNIISNAFKYTKYGNSIIIEFGAEEKNLNISVKDTGMGIDEDDLEHVFKQFFQSRSSGKEHIAGSGIGLAFSKKLVEMHYGYISASSRVNEGTTINIQLPIVKKQIEEDEVLDEKEIKLPKEKELVVDKTVLTSQDLSKINIDESFSNALIFYVEDNLEMRIYVSQILEKYFKVKSFSNGKECLEALEHNWPDLVISDVQMPVLSGLELCLAIKSDLKTSHIPVILLTALTNIKDHIKGLRDGADAYIKKPFNIKHLIAKVESLLENRKKLSERYQVGIPLTKENNKNNRNDNAFLEKLYSIIEDNIDNQDFDINDLAKELYLNRTHFYQKVKVLTNKTPFELIKIYRLKKAAQLLVQQKLSVNEVFLMTGFKSRTHFTKIFKETYDVSPSKYASENEKKFS